VIFQFKTIIVLIHKGHPISWEGVHLIADYGAYWELDITYASEEWQKKFKEYEKNDLEKAKEAGLR